MIRGASIAPLLHQRSSRGLCATLSRGGSGYGPVGYAATLLATSSLPFPHLRGARRGSGQQAPAGSTAWVLMIGVPGEYRR
jgi:hypothetical protein